MLGRLGLGMFLIYFNWLAPTWAFEFLSTNLDKNEMHGNEEKGGILAPTIM